MSIVIAYYVGDPAGKGIAYNIVSHIGCDEEKYNWLGISSLREAYRCKDRNLYVLGFDVDVIELEVLETLSNKTKYFIIVSRHSARSGKPSLTTHPPGNPWGRNDAGGRPWEIPPPNPVLMWHVLGELRKYSIETNLHGYEICYEVTHHGPTSLSKPVTFVELGSSENEWNDSRAQRIIAIATLNAIDRIEVGDNDCVVAIGFGGTHYAPIFTRRAFEEGECYGHMIPNYVIKELTLAELRAVTRKVIELTPGRRRVVIEKMRREIRSVIEEEASNYGLEVVKY